MNINKPQKRTSDMYIKRILKSAYAPAQSDLNLCYQSDETLHSRISIKNVHREGSNQTARMRRLI